LTPRLGVGFDRLWVLNFLFGWIHALRWQLLLEMERLRDFLFRHI
jgi:hypothetical protein